jgi:hypothetical protein
MSEDLHEIKREMQLMRGDFTTEMRLIRGDINSTRADINTNAIDSARQFSVLTTQMTDLVGKERPGRIDLVETDLIEVHKEIAAVQGRGKYQAGFASAVSSFVTGLAFTIYNMFHMR